MSWFPLEPCLKLVKTALSATDVPPSPLGLKARSILGVVELEVDVEYVVAVKAVASATVGSQPRLKRARRRRSSGFDKLDAVIVVIESQCRHLIDPLQTRSR